MMEHGKHCPKPKKSNGKLRILSEMRKPGRRMNEAMRIFDETGQTMTTGT